MNDLKKTTNRTHDAVEIIATTFDQVHAKVRELLRVTNDKAGLAQQAEKLAVLHAYTTSLKFHQITAAIKTSQDAVDNMKGVLRTAQDSYDRASKNYPSSKSSLLRCSDKSNHSDHSNGGLWSISCNGIYRLRHISHLSAREYRN